MLGNILVGCIKDALLKFSFSEKATKICANFCGLFRKAEFYQKSCSQNFFLLTFSRKMLREDRWQNLIEQFRTENFRLYQLSNQSVFAVSLQAGLSALKTTQCYRQSVDRNNECPVCHAALNKLAATLPFAHCSQSRLICHITGKALGKFKVVTDIEKGSG